MTPPKDKPDWGGKRPNQPGRPKAKVTRVPLSCRVLPSTKGKLDKLAKKKGGLGKAIDSLLLINSTNVLQTSGNER